MDPTVNMLATELNGTPQFVLVYELLYKHGGYKKGTRVIMSHPYYFFTLKRWRSKDRNGIHLGNINAEDRSRLAFVGYYQKSGQRVVATKHYLPKLKKL